MYYGYDIMNLGSKYYGCKISNAPPSNILKVGNHGHDEFSPVVCHGYEDGVQNIIAAKHRPPPSQNILRGRIQHKGCDTQTPVVCHG
jgi:hypothetical protein